MRLIFFLLATIALSGVIHIATILIIPQLAPHDAWSRMSALVGEQSYKLLPRAVPGEEVIPLMDPAIIYAVCRYDLNTGPLLVNATLPDTFWSIAGHTRTGIVYHSITGQAAPRGVVRIELRNIEQMREIALKEGDEETIESTLFMEAPESEGFLLFRSLVGSPSQRKQIEDLAKATTCQPLQLANQ